MELKDALIQAAKTLTIDEIVAAIDSSSASASISDPYAFAAYLKLKAG